jgi:predicted phage terminase large subunit-like protein
MSNSKRSNALQPPWQAELEALKANPNQYLASIAAERARRHLVETQRNAAAVRERCTRLAGFVREAWKVLEPRQTYTHGWHIDAICAHLEAVTFGRINRLLINVPPGSSKSLLTSVIWPSWEWSQGFASYRYLATSFNDGPVKRDTRKSRDLILSPWYQALWPEIRLTRAGETSFANSATGTREGVAFGSLTSQRGDRLIIDDPHSTETAESETERTKATRMFREGALDRLNDLEKSAIVVIMQRLHERDISGTILKLPELGFEHLLIPMEFEPERRCTTSIGWTDPRTELDELMEPGRFPRAAIDRIKIGKGSYAYAGQYQQRPAPREGGMFNRAWFEVVDAAPAGLTYVRDWDLAGTVAKPGTDPDWTVGLKMGRDSKGFHYITDLTRMRGSPHEVERTILATAQQDGTSCTVSIKQDPGQAGKAQVEAMIRMLSGYLIKSASETGSKETRAAPFAAQCEAGNVKLVRAPWVEAFLDEIELFPFGRHDDQVDAAASGFNVLAANNGPARWLAMMDEVEAKRREQQQ